MLVSEIQFLLRAVPMHLLTTLESETHPAEGLAATVMV
jgi:hypothetical protein